MTTLLKRGRSKGSFHDISFPVQLVNITDAATISAYPFEYSGRVVALRVVVDEAVTTASDASTFTLSITRNGVNANVSGCAVSTTSANMTPKGALLSGAATAPGDWSFTSSDTFTVTASSTTSYAEGSCSIHVVVEET